MQGASSGLSLWNSWNGAQQLADGKKTEAAGGGTASAAGGEVKSTQTMYSYTPSAAAISAGLSTSNNYLNLGVPAVNWDTIFDTTNPFTVSPDKLRPYLHNTTSYDYYAQGQALADSWGRF
jgi:hypothetical protein